MLSPAFQIAAPKIALAGGTEKMSISLKSGEPVKVFLDRNVSARSVIIEGAVQSQQVRWGPIEEEVAITGWRRKPMRDGDARWIAGEIACLPTVARLATDGTITLFEAHESRFEAMHAQQVARGTKGDIFARAAINRVPDAVDRSIFRPGTVDIVASRQEVIEFCRFLREATPELLEKTPELWDRLPETMQGNLRELGRFHELIDALPYEKHWPDALHLWTAETHGAGYFLTLDQKFINALTMTARVDLPTRPARPSQLLDDLGVQDRDPLPAEHLKFYNYPEMLN